MFFFIEGPKNSRNSLTHFRRKTFNYIFGIQLPFELLKLYNNHLLPLITEWHFHPLTNTISQAIEEESVIIVSTFQRVRQELSWGAQMFCSQTSLAE